MAKLSHGADTWRSEGLERKYKALADFDTPKSVKSKRDKVKWCGGKQGREHNWHRYQKMYWSDEQWKYVDLQEIVKCFTCDKKRSHKVNNSSLPLHIWLKHEGGIDVVQVRVDGKYPPIKQLEYRKDARWCYECQYWH